MSKNVTQVHHTSEDELVEKILNGVDKKFLNFQNNFQPKEPTTWLTKKEVATILSVSLVTVDDWSRKNILSPFRIGNRIRFKRKEIEQALTKIND